MKYAKRLRERFPSLTLIPEDLFFLESFQIKYLPDRAPQKEFAVLLHAIPIIKQFLISKYPPIEPFINSIIKKYKPLNNQILINEYCRELLWEIADLIIFNKYPEVFDSHANFNWDINEILPAKSLAEKIVIDAGAGSGRIAFLAAPFAKTVFAVEPVSAFRNFIREKAKKEEVHNLFAIDGFLDSIPLPDSSADILITSNAIGWNLSAELEEIERIVKSGGLAIHLMRNLNLKIENPFHDILISAKWKYAFKEYENSTEIKLKYSKIINKK